jgi:hypothetical protein
MTIKNVTLRILKLSACAGHIVLSVTFNCIKLTVIMKVYSECRYAECRYAECHMLNVFMLNVIMLNVFMLNVIMLNVVVLNVMAPSTVLPNLMVLATDKELKWARQEAVSIPS